MILIFSYLISITSAYFVCGDGSESYKIGDKVPLCVNFQTVDGVNVVELDRPVKSVFEPKLDKYSGIQVKGAAEKYQFHDEVWVQVMGSAGTPTPWMYFIHDEKIAHVYSVVVKLEDGEIDEIKWDNYCDMCSDDCIELEDEEVCAEKVKDCDSLEDCDPRFYVSWMGKDSDDVLLTSASFRLSQFRKYSMNQAFDNAKQDF